MNINRNASLRPTAITPANRARQAAAIAAHDARLARAAAIARLQRLAYWLAFVALTVTLFYSATN